ncbi:hypothetical protein CFBP4215_04773 [Pseudomonas syringae pv. syringae]|nr:hypothetical protein CFBP4215_04773 [Pseudomonas syringae pv. syringae]
MHTHAEHGYDGVLAGGYRSSRSSVGMPWVTLCVTDLRRAARPGSGVERHTILRTMNNLSNQARQRYNDGPD